MANALTPEQRERKRQRDAEYRARKAAQKFQSKVEPIQKFDILLDSKVEQAMQDLLKGKIKIEDFVEIEKAAGPNAITFHEATPVVLQKVGYTPMKNLVLNAQLGDYVFAPVTQLYATVQKTFRGGGRLLTEDGEHMWANQCPHSTEERASKGTVIFFEMVGDGNKDFADGATGEVHRFSRCNKVIL
jgi:hypothetical protein